MKENYLTNGLTVQDLKDNDLIVFEAIVGSRAYGLDLPTSDTDIRGVYVLPPESYLHLSYQKQVSDATNDTVYYEMGKFLNMLQSNNPTVLELLYVPEKCILHITDAFKVLIGERDKFLTKKARLSFGGYAIQQIKKARGLNKKIVNEMPKEKKNITDFCWIVYNGQTTPLTIFAADKGYDIKELGVVALDHTRDSYTLYYPKRSLEVRGMTADWVSRPQYKGVADKESNQLKLSSVPKGEKPIATMTFCADTYTKYCKEYKEYWEWVEKRNPVRYEHNAAHGKGYDSKNMMHCVRLLRMAKELALTGKLNVFREDREELLAIRLGNVEYSDLLDSSEALIAEMDELFKKSDLRDENISYEELNLMVYDYRSCVQFERLDYDFIPLLTE